MLLDHDHAIPLIGGPLCGESVTMKGCYVPKKIPLFHNDKFYNYELVVNEHEYSYEVFYEFTNEPSIAKENN